MKRDLRLLRLRGVMDPKRFYKNPDATKFPTHFVMGTVVEGPGEFNSGVQAYCKLYSILQYTTIGIIAQEQML